MKVRAYVANMNHRQLIDHLNLRLQAYTIYEATGVFEGATEPASVIEVLGYHDHSEWVNALALYAHKFGEDSILVDVTNEYGHFPSLGHVSDAEPDFVRWERLR